MDGLYALAAHAWVIIQLIVQGVWAFGWWGVLLAYVALAVAWHEATR
jgi:predicted PurR-regulated permease PerM